MSDSSAWFCKQKGHEIILPLLDQYGRFLGWPEHTFEKTGELNEKKCPQCGSRTYTSSGVRACVNAFCSWVEEIITP